METSAGKLSKFNTRQMVRISILGLLGYIILMFRFALPIFPEFIELDVANLPSIIASISMGPWAGVAVEFVKNVLKVIMGSRTIGIGEISNFICGSSLVIPLGLIYRKIPNIKGYIAGSIAGVITLSIVACLSNYFFVIPMYAAAFGGMEAIIGMVSKINANVGDLKSIIIFSILPFNLLKGGLNVITGYLIYRVAKPLFVM